MRFHELVETVERLKTNPAVGPYTNVTLAHDPDECHNELVSVRINGSPREVVLSNQRPVLGGNEVGR